MAAVLVLVAGFLGFLAAMAGWILFDFGFFGGLGLWTGSGLLGLALGLGLSHLPGVGGPPALPRPHTA